MLTSIHRTPQRTLDIADQLSAFIDNVYYSDNNAGFCCVWVGGMSFQLPAVVAAYLPHTPMIAVPLSANVIGGGLDAFISNSNLPPGIPVGVVAPHSDKKNSLPDAFLISEKIVNNYFDYVVLIPKDYSCDYFDKAKSLLDSLEVPYKIKEPEEDKAELCINIFDNFIDATKFDFFDGVCLSCANPTSKYADITLDGILNSISKCNNSLYFTRPENAAIFAAQILSASRKGLRKNLVEYKRDAKIKYGDNPKINDAFFSR